ncbi:MAG: SpoIIIAC/SpoIIIAD family protein [Acutalibacteraceae bacterium]|nr:SpoIIIAC/SpoIIIAD family protein [Acutalibacteraceae bacterium]
MNGELLRILLLLLVVAVVTLVVRSRAPEHSFLLVIAATATVLLYLLCEIFPTIRGLTDMFKTSGNQTVYFKTALKALGIAYLTNFTADICRDFGQSALASMAELAGKCAIFVLSVPLMCAVLQTALKFAGV